MDFYAMNHAGLIQTYLSDDPIEPWVARVISEFSLYSTGKTPIEAMTGLINEAIPLYIECEKLAGNKVSYVLMDLYNDLKKAGQ
jgi:predicted RNase H-like HicB family nuclease